MPAFEFTIRRLRAQKDNFAPVGEGDFGAPSFMESSAKEAEVLYLKRVVAEVDVHGPLGGEEARGKFTAIISLRGNLVTLVPGTGCPLSPAGLMVAVRSAAQPYCRVGDVLGGARYRHGDSTYVCTTPDGLGLADIFHHLREYGPFVVDLPDKAELFCNRHFR